MRNKQTTTYNELLFCLLPILFMSPLPLSDDDSLGSRPSTLTLQPFSSGCQQKSKSSVHILLFNNLIHMGVFGLKDLIEKSCAEGASVEDVLKLNAACKVIPIDISNVMYSLKYCIESGSPMWITRAVTCLRTMKRLFKRPLIVFDGQVPAWKIVAASRLKQRVANKRKHTQEKDDYHLIQTRKQRFILWKAKQAQHDAGAVIMTTPSATTITTATTTTTTTTQNEPPALEQRVHTQVPEQQIEPTSIHAVRSTSKVIGVEPSMNNKDSATKQADDSITSACTTTIHSDSTHIASSTLHVSVDESSEAQPIIADSEKITSSTAPSSAPSAYEPFADENFSAEEVAAFENWDENETDQQDDLQKQDLEKAARVDVEVPPEDYEVMKALCRIERIEYVQARFEADNVFRQCTLRGLAKCIVSQDRDGLMQGAPVLVHLVYNTFRTCDATTKVLKIYQLDKIRKHLKVNQDRFIHYCFVLGCDYSLGLPLIKSGRIAKAFADYKTLENLVLRYPAKPKDPVKRAQWNEFLSRYKYALTNAIETKWDDFELLPDDKLQTSDNYDITNYKWHEQVQPISREECAHRTIPSGLNNNVSVESKPPSTDKSMMESMLMQRGVTVCTLDMYKTHHQAPMSKCIDNDVQMMSSENVHNASKKIQLASESQAPSSDKNQIHGMTETPESSAASSAAAAAAATSAGATSVTVPSECAPSKNKYASVECVQCKDPSHITNPCVRCGNEQCLQCVKGHTSCKPCCACANKYRREAYDDVRNKAKTKHKRVEEMQKRLENICTVEALYKELGIFVFEGSSSAAAASGAAHSTPAASASKYITVARADIPYTAPVLSSALASKYKRQKCGEHTSSTTVIDITGNSSTTRSNALPAASSSAACMQNRSNGKGTQSAPILIADNKPTAHIINPTPILIEDNAPATAK